MTVFLALGYRSCMKPLSKMVLMLAGVSFLAVTLSGFHVHADAADHGETAPHAHVHSYFGPADLDEDHIDVSVFDPAVEFSDGGLVVLPPSLFELEPAPSPGSGSSADRHDFSPQRHFRWRPELRGPPAGKVG